MADDYMSDAFLEKLADVRPGLVGGKRKLCDRTAPQSKGKAKPFNKKEHAQSKARLNAKEKLVEGLKTPCISEDNPGFKMMRMMGYSPGTGLGKAGEGISEPIIIEPFKEKKAGLGKEAEELEKASKKVRYEMDRLRAYKRNEVHILQTYRKNMRNAAVEKHAARDTRKSQTVCAQLDNKQGLSPPEVWFWPPPVRKKTIIDDGQDYVEEEPYEQPDPSHILPLLTVYLRETHLYCVWCGMSYQNIEDMMYTCPGDSYRDHETDTLDFDD